MACHIRSAAINLGGIFTRKAAPAVAPLAAVSINNNLTTRDSAIPHGASHHKPTGRIDKIFGISIDQILRNNLFNDLFD